MKRVIIAVLQTNRNGEYKIERSVEVDADKAESWIAGFESCSEDACAHTCQMPVPLPVSKWGDLWCLDNDPTVVAQLEALGDGYGEGVWEPLFE